MLEVRSLFRTQRTVISTQNNYYVTIDRLIYGQMLCTYFLLSSLNASIL